ncbi:MAG: hypothetical protein HP491_11895 [Nitrospira sp.]|nr:hypothetical protein [Nitrospira sp.]MBH0181564.1 hypothetical protein [Nitrospira sp.]MBH0184708.1 hypothetical protein [Nitrospira sp.]
MAWPSAQCGAIALAAWFLAAAAFAAGTPEDGESAKPNHLRVSAILESEGAYGITRDRASKLEFIIDPQLEYRFSEDTRVTAIARLYSEGFDYLEPGRPSQAEVAPNSRRLLLGDRSDIELREFYLKTLLWGTHLTLGKQQVVWGKADGLKLLDVVNPQNFREFILDNFDDSRIPLWTLNAELSIGGGNLQFLWIPDRSNHQLPKTDATFAFTSPLIVPQAPPGAAVNLRSIERPNNVVTDSDIGMRFSRFWHGWDLTVNYLYHYADFPVFFQSVLLAPDGATVTVNPRYERNHLIGGSFSNAFGNLTVRGEATYNTDRFVLTTNRNGGDGVIKTGEIAYVIGLDWFGIQDSLVSVQLFQSWLLNPAQGIVREALDTTTTLLLRRHFLNETLEAEMLWLHNVNFGDGLIRPKVSYELRDNMKIWTGFDLLYGDHNGLFGQFDRNDRLVIGMELGL